jgi:hypothetical protein
MVGCGDLGGDRERKVTGGDRWREVTTGGRVDAIEHEPVLHVFPSVRFER